MNRRFFIRGAAASMGAGAIGVGAAGLSGLFSAPVRRLATADTNAGRIACASSAAPHPIMLSHLVNTARTLLHHNGLLQVSTDITDFYNDVVDKYIAHFTENDVLNDDGAYNEEINEAALILGDTACHTPTPPATGCTYYEAWKFFRHHEAMKIFPADSSVPFRNLTPAQQHYVCAATTAYTGMLMNAFGSLMGKLYPDRHLADTLDSLQKRTEELAATLDAPPPAAACQPGKSQPPSYAARRMLT